MNSFKGSVREDGIDRECTIGRVEQKGDVGKYLKGLQDGAEARLGLVRMASAAGPFLVGIPLLIFVAVDSGEGSPGILRIFFGTLHVLYWAAVIWWGMRGYGLVSIWWDELKAHFAEVFAGSDIFYLVLEHELPEQLQEKGPWYTQFTGGKPPADLRFTSRIAWFLGQYSMVMGKLGLPSLPGGAVYTLSDYAGLLFWVFWLAESFIPDSVDSFLVISFALHIIVPLAVPTFCIKTLANAAVASAIVDYLRGDMEPKAMLAG